MRVVGTLKWHGPRARALERDGAVDGLRNATEHLLGVSREVAPIERGDLVRSAKASVDPANLEGAVSYDTVYAARQHEELTWRHDPGRQAKYLEEPLYAEMDTIRALIAAAIRRKLR